jgi:hypothetical protein
MPDHVMNYVECEAAAELTLAQWRRSRITPRPRRRLAFGTFLPARRRPALAG